MAASSKFRIPTVDEMEQADKDALSERPESLFKKNTDTDVSLSTNTSQRPSGKESAVPKSLAIRPNVPLQSRTSLPKADVVSEKTVSTAHQTLNSAKSGGSDAPEPVAAKTGPTNSLIVNTRQRGNPILKSVRNIPWEYGNIVPDYVMGQSNCALFLSLRYHQLHPNYIHERLKQLGKSYELRVMLVQVDVKDPHYLLKDLAKMCILSDCSLILAFSAEEAGRYLETYKIFENKPPEAIMEKTEENFMAKFTDCLTRVKSVNKTDCATLLSHFGNLSSVIEASREDLSLCPGFGPQKANRLFDIFHEPFLRSNTRKRRLSGSTADAAR